GPQAAAIGAGALLVGLVDYRLLFAAIGALLVAAGGYLLTGRHLTAPAGPVPAAGPAPAAGVSAG
ncbi:MFS transporter, partial [Micromonospora sp. NPDC003776]